MPNKHWMPFDRNVTKFSDAVEFREHGVVRLGSSVFADGRKIDNYGFENNVANRDSQFGGVLEITRPNGEKYYFRFDGENWGQLVEEYDSSRPMFYGLRKEMAHSGAIVGFIYWVTYSTAGLLVPIGVTLLVLVTVGIGLCLPPIGWLFAFGAVFRYIGFMRDFARERRSKRFEKNG